MATDSQSALCPLTEILDNWRGGHDWPDATGSAALSGFFRLKTAIVSLILLSLPLPVTVISGALTVAALGVTKPRKFGENKLNIHHSSAFRPCNFFLTSQIPHAIVIFLLSDPRVTHLIFYPLGWH